MNTTAPFAAACALLLLAAIPGHADTEQTLGSLLFSDSNLSLHRNQSCASCHSVVPASGPETGQPLIAPGFVDPGNVENGSPVSGGSVSGQFGKLNAPSVGYAAFSPEFHWDNTRAAYVGGQFWNGRATNLQAQAAMPFLNPAEMAMPSRWAVVTRLKENATYRQLFNDVFGINLDDLPANDLAPATSPPPAGVLAAFDAAAQAISEFERGATFNQFTSKFDYWLAGMTSLSANELNGFNLFKKKARCATCHLSSSGIDRQGNMIPPLFTDFTYANLGLPRNVSIPGNPAPDPGLGGRAEIAAASPGGAELGKHKVMSLRNIALTPPYGHNGVFATLDQITHFYNTRDVLGRVAASTDAGFGVTGWPAPEVPQNINTANVGDLGLTQQEEADVVAFMKTLTDNYPATGQDPNVPPGTPSPFANLAIPAIPTRLALGAPAVISLTGRLGKYYRLEFADSLTGTNHWRPLSTNRFGANGMLFPDPTAVLPTTRFYRAVQLP